MTNALRLAAFLLMCLAVRLVAAEPLELVDGDRVVLLGSTVIEREQSSGYWETMMTTRFPRCNVVFRNLGWSGDTVFGEARAGFGVAADGFRELKEHVEALKPTVIFVSYGANESFAGEAGLPVSQPTFQRAGLAVQFPPGRVDHRPFGLRNFLGASPLSKPA